MEPTLIRRGGRGPARVRCRGAAALFAVAWALLPGCSVFDFDIDQHVPEQRVQGSLVGQLVGGLLPNPFPLSVDFQQETKARGTGPVKAAALTQLAFHITPTAGAGNTFDFVQSAQVFVESTVQGSMLPRQKIAEITQVPRGATDLHLTTFPGVNLVPYINEGARTTSTATGSAPPRDVTFDGDLTIHVNTF